jgi:isopentenyl-diphosphate delta-isomerase
VEDVAVALLSDPAKNDLLVLVDGLDREVGTATKTQAHVDGRLHRAFSVVLVRDGAHGPEVLLSQRAKGKYHSAGLWANSCCSHPRAGETTLEAAARRVPEELGCEVVGLREVGSFAYRAVFANGLVEHEYDHVLVGRPEGEVVPDPSEVSEVRWAGVETVARELAQKPEAFAAWAPMVLSVALRDLWVPKSYECHRAR